MMFLEIYLMFWIFSIFGWIMEIIVCSIDEKKLVNRGFLLGPYCPIYGFGGISMLILYQYRSDPFVCFVLALVICSVIEYVTGYLMEKIFKVRFWDYSKEPFNLNGRICLRNAIAFGFLGMLCTSYIYPLMFNVLGKMNHTLLIVLCILIFIVTTSDIIVSCNVMNKIKKKVIKNLSEWRNKDATSDIKNLIKNNLVNNNYLERRLSRAYNYFSGQKEEFLCKIDEFKGRVKHSNKLFLYGTICGILSTFILGMMTQKYSLWFRILVPTGFFIDLVIYYIRRKNDE